MKIEIVKKHYFLIIFLSITIILESILSITLPYLSKLLLDEVIIGNHYSLLSMIILSFAVIIVLQLLLGSLISRGSAKIETYISFRLRDNIIKKCLNLKIINSSQRSNIQTVLIQDTESYATNLVNIFYTVFSNSIRVVGCLILVFYINPLLSTICVFFLCLYIIWIIFIGEKIKSLTNKIQLSKEKIIQLFRANRHSITVIDSDKTDSNQRINHSKARIKKEFKENHSLVWVTQRKEIENYLSQRLIKEVYRVDKQIGQYEKIDNFLGIASLNKKLGTFYVRNKVTESIKFVKHMDETDLKILDFEERIKQIVDHVRVWNGMD